MHRRSSIRLALMCLFSASVVFAAASTGTGAADEVMVKPEDIKWQPMPRDWANGPPPPPGAKNPPDIAIISGDPTKDGSPFVFRMRPAEHGATVPIPPHWHPTDENITVLSGVFCVGEGDKYDDKACQDMPPGSYISLPKGMHHFAVSRDSTIQVHGIGPFKIFWVR